MVKFTYDLENSYIMAKVSVLASRPPGRVDLQIGG